MDSSYRCYHQMHKPYMHEELVDHIQECEAVCEHMTYHLKKMEHCSPSRVNQALLLRDCADICGLTAKYVARDSFFSREAAALCAQICIACGNECSKFPDQMSQHCAQVCYNCAKHCSDFALGKKHC